jgi:hypothetical protein
MRVDTLHREMMTDVMAMHDAVARVLPVQMPKMYETRQMNVSGFLNRLNKVTEPLGLYHERKDDAEMEPVGMVTSGLWLAKSELPQNNSSADLRLLWHVHPTVSRIQWTGAMWNRRRYFFWQMFMHELVHRYQFVHMGDRTPPTYRPRSDQRDTKEAREYYGNYDEIEAHSHSCAMELMTWWPGLSMRDAIHEAMTCTSRMVTPTYCLYDQTFADTPKHPAVTHFKRKVKAWFELLQSQPDVYQMLGLPSLTNPK